MAQGNNAEYYKALNAICGAFRLSDEWIDTFQEIANITSSISSINFKTLSERYSQIAQDLNPTIMRMREAISNAVVLPENMSPNNLSKTLATAISMATNSIRTPEIENLLMSYRESYWVEGIREFANNIFSEPATKAANVACLKTMSDIWKSLVDNYPYGFSNMLESMHIGTAYMLSNNGKIDYDYKKRAFCLSNNGECESNVSTLNVSSDFVNIFLDFTLEELLEFVNVPSSRPEFASTHPVGEKIWETIRDCDNYMGFDREYYFHARLMEKDGHLFVESDMRKAPNEVVSYGRFNHLKESHYYFTDTEIGAKTEIHKHDKHTGKESRIQVARIRPRPSILIKMIDLSGRNTSNKNAFLEMIRYEYDGDTRCRPTQYLLPEHVTSCCKNAGIDGIKYYGNKEYRNYVCWEDYYFDIDNLFCNISDYEYHDT